MEETKNTAVDPAEENEVIELTAGASGVRIDAYLSQQELGLSRAGAQRLIKEGLVTVAGKLVRASLKLKGGEPIRVELPPPVLAEAVPEPLELKVIYEDSQLIVLDKTRGMVVHPSPGHPSGTVVNGLLHRCKDLSGVGGVMRPGIVHRLDKDTSGLLVVAKDDETHRALQAGFKGREVEKVYLAVVLGRMVGDGVIDKPVGRDPRDRKRMSLESRAGKPALTRWRSLAELDNATVVEARIETGRTHQIRVHLASEGHPVVGDPIYGGIKRAKGIMDKRVRSKLMKLDAQMLHSHLLGFDHPVTGERMRFRSPLPGDMRELITGLGGVLDPEWLERATDE